MHDKQNNFYFEIANIPPSKLTLDDWLKKLGDFDANNSKFSNTQKNIFQYIKNYILKREKEYSDGNKFIINSLICSFIKDVVISNKTDLLSSYNDLPEDLTSDAMKELKNLAIEKFNDKLHSIFVEFLTYKHLLNQGYAITSFKRFQGSCDLALKKDQKEYNFEVKFKQNDNIFISRITDVIVGLSLFDKNKFCRNKTFKLFIETENFHKNFNKIVEEIYDFMSKQQDIYKGKYIEMFPIDYIKKSRDINEVCKELGSSTIYSPFNNMKSAKEYIKNIFIGEEWHISKIKHKYEKYYKNNENNFVGFLTWTIPFNQEIDVKLLKEAFQEVLREQNIEFGFHLLIDRYFKDSHYFVYKNFNQFK